MENQAGFPLSERINNRLFPTGEALLEDAEAIFLLHARLENRVQDFRESKAGHLHIVATPPFGHSVVPLALRNAAHGWVRPCAIVFGPPAARSTRRWGCATAT